MLHLGKLISKAKTNGGVNYDFYKVNDFLQTKSSQNKILA